MLKVLTQSDKKVVGLRELLRELKVNNIAHIYVAQDAEEHIKAQIDRAVAYDDTVELHFARSMKELGMASGIKVPAACAAILK